jgi:hypothetical protein
MMIFEWKMRSFSLLVQGTLAELCSELGLTARHLKPPLFQAVVVYLYQNKQIQSNS